MNNKNILDEALLGKFLAGEATPEEAMLVNDWIAASEENKTLYTQTEGAWALERQHIKPASQKDAVWNQLEQAIQLGQEPARKLFFTPYRIAAAILLLISVTGAIYFYNSSEQKPSAVAWEMKQTLNEVAGISLPDGSSVTVNRNSTLKWPVKLEGDRREIVLEGEAFFDVSHDPDRPFVITTDEIKIKVLGTAFNVQHHQETDEIETEVTRGKVLMYTNEKQIIIDAGMKGVYRKQTRELVLVKMKNENDIAYATHTLSFSGSTLKEVSDQLSKAYGVQFIFENKKIQDCRLTSEYQRKSLSFIMNVISASLNLTYTIKDNTVYISGDGCL